MNAVSSFRKRFNFQPVPQVDAKKDNQESNKHSWTMVDSDGESDAECSVTSTGNSRKSSTGSLQVLQFDSNPEFVSVESISALIDQIDMLGLIDFVFNQCTSSSNHISLFAFANWLITTLESSVDFLHRPPINDCPRFQRQIVKRIVEMVDTLLTGLRMRIDGSIATFSTMQEAVDHQSSIYPNLSQVNLTEDAADLRVILAQYDELCLRVTRFILSSATSLTTRLTCWRRFARMSPFRLFSSRSKVMFYDLLLSSVSPNIEDSYVNGLLSAQPDGGAFGVDETVIGEMDTKEKGEVFSLLRVGLLENECLAEPFFTLLGQLASVECRPSPRIPRDGDQSDQFWRPNDVPVLEKKMVQRVLDILFEVNA